MLGLLTKSNIFKETLLFRRFTRPCSIPWWQQKDKTSLASFPFPGPQLWMHPRVSLLKYGSLFVLSILLKNTFGKCFRMVSSNKGHLENKSSGHEEVLWCKSVKLTYKTPVRKMITCSRNWERPYPSWGERFSLSDALLSPRQLLRQ